MGAVLLLVGVFRVTAPHGPEHRPDWDLLIAGAITFLGFLALTTPTRGPSATRQLGWTAVAVAGVQLGLRVWRSARWNRWEHQLLTPAATPTQPGAPDEDSADGPPPGLPPRWHGGRLPRTVFTAVAELPCAGLLVAVAAPRCTRPSCRREDCPPRDDWQALGLAVNAAVGGVLIHAVGAAAIGWVMVAVTAAVLTVLGVLCTPLSWWQPRTRIHGHARAATPELPPPDMRRGPGRC